MPWPQHWHQTRPMGHRVRNCPASPYPRPSARVVTEGSRVRVSGSGLGFAARMCRALVRTPLAGTSAYTLKTPNRGARVVVFSRPGRPYTVTSATNTSSTTSALAAAAQQRPFSSRTTSATAPSTKYALPSSPVFFMVELAEVSLATCAKAIRKTSKLTPAMTTPKMASPFAVLVADFIHWLTFTKLSKLENSQKKTAHCAYPVRAVLLPHVGSPFAVTGRWRGAR